jgi:hypothetical protein
MNTDQTADCTGQPNKSVVEVRISERRSRHDKIAEILNKLLGN